MEWNVQTQREQISDIEIEKNGKAQEILKLTEKMKLNNLNFELEKKTIQVICFDKQN
jgi:hypothetical protein